MADNFTSRQAPIGQTATCVAVTQTWLTILLQDRHLLTNSNICSCYTKVANNFTSRHAPIGLTATFVAVTQKWLTILLQDRHLLDKQQHV